MIAHLAPDRHSQRRVLAVRNGAQILHRNLAHLTLGDVRLDAIKLSAKARAVMRWECPYAHRLVVVVCVDTHVAERSGLPRPSRLRPDLNLGVVVAFESFLNPRVFAEGAAIGLEDHLPLACPAVVLVRPG